MTKVVGRQPADARRRAGVRRNGAALAVVLRDHGAGEVERGAGDVGVDVDAAGEDDHARRVDRAAALDVGDDPAVAMQTSRTSPLMPLAGS